MPRKFAECISHPLLTHPRLPFLDKAWADALASVRGRMELQMSVHTIWFMNHTTVWPQRRTCLANANLFFIMSGVSAALEYRALCSHGSSAPSSKQSCRRTAYTCFLSTGAPVSGLRVASGHCATTREYVGSCPDFFMLSALVATARRFAARNTGSGPFRLAAETLPGCH